MRKAKTRKLIRQAQAGAAVLLLAGAALALVPMSWGEGDKARPEHTSRTIASAATHQPERLLDEGSLASKLKAIAVPMPSEAPPPKPPDTADVVVTPEAPVQPLWEYIGGMIGPGVRKAVVTLSGAQRVVVEGDLIGDTRVNAITSNFIMIEEKGAEKRVDRKGQRVRQAMAQGNPSKVDAAAASKSGKGPPRMASNARVPKGKGENPALEGKIPASAQAKSDAIVHDKQRQRYVDAVRENGYQPLDPESLPKLGLDGFNPSPEEIEELMERARLEQTGGGGN